MNLPIFAIVVGVLSCISNTVLTGRTIAGLVSFSQQDHNRPLSSIFDDFIFAFTFISVIFYVIMCALAILMILGVRKTRPEWIGPWIILSALDIVCTMIFLCMVTFVGPIGAILWRLVYIAISCLLWYPIYTLWRNMRSLSPPKEQPASETEYDALPVYPTKEESKQSDCIPHSENV